MNKVAFVCPIYDSKNHFNYGINLLRTKEKNEIDVDLYFIFSNTVELEKFEKLVKTSGIEKSFRYLVLPESETKYKSQVTIKKFYALRCLKKQYKYIATIDSESEFIKKLNYEDILENIWENREMLKANKSYNSYFIMRTCYKTLGIFDNKLLHKETNNYLYNIWFNEIPVYKCDLLDEFFAWVASLNQNYKNEWLCFEYYIFAAFLIIEKGYHIKKYNIESMGGVMEYLYVFPAERQKHIIDMLNTHWTSSDDAINEKIGIRFHLDRNADEDTYNSSSFFYDINKFKRLRFKQMVKDLVRLK